MMQKRVALVTGAARGIGRAIAADLYRDHGLAFTCFRTTARDAQTDMPDAIAIQADLSDDAAAAGFITGEVLTVAGGYRL